MTIKSNKLAAVIFDMDGVLVDSIKYNHAALNETLAKYGITFTKEEYAKLGVSFRDKIVQIEKKYNKKLPPLMELSRINTQMQLEMLKADLHNAPKVKPLLAELERNGIKLAVGTASMRYRTELILKTLGIIECFSVIVTADEVQEHKPNPAVYLEVAKQLGVASEECAVVEDAPDGILAGKAAGMKVVGRLTEYHTKSELAKADLIVNNITELNYKKIANLF